MAHESRTYTLATQLLSDADVAQIILPCPRRLDDPLGAKAANHYARRADWTVESQDLQRTRNREAQYDATVVRGPSGDNPPADLGDTMSLPAEFACIVQVREA